MNDFIGGLAVLCKDFRRNLSVCCGSSIYERETRTFSELVNLTILKQTLRKEYV